MHVISICYAGDSQHRKCVDNSLLEMICVDLQPPKIVEDQGFLNLLKTLDPRYVPPSRTIMRSSLPNKYKSTKEALEASLSAIKYVALTTDIWTSRQTEGYITVTCHFVSDDWKFRSVVLATVNFSDSHTAEHISEQLGKIVDEWSLRPKVVGVVTDNAANCVAAIRLPGWRHIPCFAHTLNLIVKDGIKADKAVMEVQKKCKAVVLFFSS